MIARWRTFVAVVFIFCFIHYSSTEENRNLNEVTDNKGAKADAKELKDHGGQASETKASSLLLTSRKVSTTSSTSKLTSATEFGIQKSRSTDLGTTLNAQTTLQYVGSRFAQTKQRPLPTTVLMSQASHYSNTPKLEPSSQIVTWSTPHVTITSMNYGFHKTASKSQHSLNSLTASPDTGRLNVSSVLENSGGKVLPRSSSIMTSQSEFSARVLFTPFANSSKSEASRVMVHPTQSYEETMINTYVTKHNTETISVSFKESPTALLLRPSTETPLAPPYTPVSSTILKQQPTFSQRSGSTPHFSPPHLFLSTKTSEALSSVGLTRSSHTTKVPLDSSLQVKNQTTTSYSSTLSMKSSSKAWDLGPTSNGTAVIAATSSAMIPDLAIGSISISKTSNVSTSSTQGTSSVASLSRPSSDSIGTMSDQTFFPTSEAPPPERIAQTSWSEVFPSSFAATIVSIASVAETETVAALRTSSSVPPSKLATDGLTLSTPGTVIFSSSPSQEDFSTEIDAAQPSITPTGVTMSFSESSFVNDKHFDSSVNSSTIPRSSYVTKAQLESSAKIAEKYSRNISRTSYFVLPHDFSTQADQRKSSLSVASSPISSTQYVANQSTVTSVSGVTPAVTYLSSKTSFLRQNATPSSTFATTSYVSTAISSRESLIVDTARHSTVSLMSSTYGTSRVPANATVSMHTRTRTVPVSKGQVSQSVPLTSSVGLLATTVTLGTSVNRLPRPKTTATTTAVLATASAWTVNESKSTVKFTSKFSTTLPKTTPTTADRITTTTTSLMATATTTVATAATTTMAAVTTMAAATKTTVATAATTTLAAATTTTVATAATTTTIVAVDSTSTPKTTWRPPTTEKMTTAKPVFIGVPEIHTKKLASFSNAINIEFHVVFPGIKEAYKLQIIAQRHGHLIFGGGDTLRTWYEVRYFEDYKYDTYVAGEYRTKSLVHRAKFNFTFGQDIRCEKKQIRYEHCNGPLQKGSYRFQLRYHVYGSVRKSAFSKVYPTAASQTTPADDGSTGLNQSSITIAVIAVLAILLVFIIIIAVVLYRRKNSNRSDPYGETEVSDCTLLTSLKRSSSCSKGCYGRGTLGGADSSLMLKHLTKGMSRPVHVKDFISWVTRSQADSDFRFAEEFESIRDIGKDQTHDASDLPENRGKNRYVNVLAYDRTRVKLSYTDDEIGSDYINASYIHGYKHPRAYIATQGPLPGTTDDFWRMIWEQNAFNIVMATQCMERNRVKCHEYWPGTKPTAYGDISVSLLSEVAYSEWVEREFLLEVEDEGSRNIKHFQYIAWPDHGVPRNASTVLDFIHTVRSNILPGHGPLVVHCSAGVGRTGTLVAIDIIMDRLQEEDAIDVYLTLCMMRIQRCSMVQTEDQYIFIHRVIVDYLRGRGSGLPFKGYSLLPKVDFEDGNLDPNSESPSANRDSGLAFLLSEYETERAEDAIESVA